MTIFLKTCLAIVCVLLFSLHSYSQKKPKPLCLPDTYIQFGSGGGFTGAVTYYILTKKGYLYRFKQLPADTLPAGTFLRKVPKREVKNCFSYIFNNRLDTCTINAPYNVYTYITVNNKGTSNSITWGDPDTAVPEPVLTLYKTLTGLINP